MDTNENYYYVLPISQEQSLSSGYDIKEGGDIKG